MKRINADRTDAIYLLHHPFDSFRKGAADLLRKGCGLCLALILLLLLSNSQASAQRNILISGLAATGTIGIDGINPNAADSINIKHPEETYKTETSSFDPTISCPANFLACIPTGNTTYTHPSNSLNATATADPGCVIPGLTYAYVLTGATTGTGTTLNGRIFNVGVTTVTWTVTDACLNQDVCSFTVTVTQTTAISATPTPQTICSGNAINTITITGAPGGTTFNWTRSNTTNVVGMDPAGPGPVTSIDGVLTNLQLTNQNTVFTLVANINGCPSIATATVTVNAPPTVADITGSNTVCLGKTTPLTSSPAGGTWSSSNTSIATVNSSGVVTGVAIGTATITYSRTVAGCPNSVTHVITVIPSPTVTAAATQSLVCAGTTVGLSSTSSISQSASSSFTNSQQEGFLNSSPLVPLSRSITVSGLPIAALSQLTNISVTVNVNHNSDQEVEIYLIAPGGTLLNTDGPGGYDQTIVAGQSIALTADKGGTGNNYTNTVFSSTAAQTIAAAGASPPFTGTFLPENSFGSLTQTTNPNGTWTLVLVDDENTGNTGVFNSFTISFTYNTGTGGTFSWTSSPAGFTSTLQNPGNVTPTVSTTYTVTVTAPNGCTAQSSV